MNTIKIAMSVFVVSLSMNIAQAQFTPTVFKPIEYHPQTPDYSILERSIQRQEERTSDAYQKYSELAQLIGEKHQKISNDRETLIWFDNEINSMLKEVKSVLDFGDYSYATELATQYIGDVYSHTELRCRIQTYEEYLLAVKYVQERTDLTYQQKQEWIEKYRYKFVPIRNSDGKVIGAKRWMDVGGPNETSVHFPETLH